MIFIFVTIMIGGHVSSLMFMILQNELRAFPQLDKHWRSLMKKEAKAAKAGKGHVPLSQRPEAAFVPGLIDEFLQVG